MRRSTSRKAASYLSFFTRLVILSAVLLAAPGSCIKKSPVYYRELPSKEIAAMKQKPCAFVHVWATWCTICLKELPELIGILGGIKKVTPVIIDISSPFVQDNFSKKWLKTLKPPFVTYLKPGTDEGYLKAIDSQWPGKELPYSALYDRGQKIKSWQGKLNLSGLPAEIEKNCP